MSIHDQLVARAVEVYGHLAQGPHTRQVSIDLQGWVQTTVVVGSFAGVAAFMDLLTTANDERFQQE